ncbi:MAG TPA: GrpB family protein [Dehalococcoidia bacterium]|nr:GrpB family protein [Dehalococcoidia bacterium]
MGGPRFGVPIVIAEYDPAWPHMFEEERGRIYAACGRDVFVAFEHVGSTAVPGLAAKPVIDMSPCLRSIAGAAPLIPKLEALGYVYQKWTESPTPALSGEGTPFRRYFTKDVDGARRYQVHMVEAGHPWVRDQVLFRNYLRTHPETARDYADLKRRLAAEYNAGRTDKSNINVGYTDRKGEFVRAVLRRAREEIAPGEGAMPEGMQR